PNHKDKSIKSRPAPTHSSTLIVVRSINNNNLNFNLRPAPTYSSIVVRSLINNNLNFKLWPAPTYVQQLVVRSITIITIIFPFFPSLVLTGKEKNLVITCTHAKQILQQPYIELQPKHQQPAGK
ncbi:unnamed protein product, partial [Ectocarpus sp. 12 AP-2014]